MDRCRGSRELKSIPDYRRHRIPGGCFSFITVNLLERRGNNLLTRRVDLLWNGVRTVYQVRPFTIDAWWSCPITSTACGRCRLATTTFQPVAPDQDDLRPKPCGRRGFYPVDWIGWSEQSRSANPARE